MTGKVNEGNEVDALKKRLKELVDVQANERAELAEKISILLKENNSLKSQVRELEAKCQSRGYTSSVEIKSPENEFGLDFSLPEKHK